MLGIFNIAGYIILVNMKGIQRYIQYIRIYNLINMSDIQRYILSGYSSKHVRYLEIYYQVILANMSGIQRYIKYIRIYPCKHIRSLEIYSIYRDIPSDFNSFYLEILKTILQVKKYILKVLQSRDIEQFKLHFYNFIGMIRKVSFI